MKKIKLNPDELKIDSFETNKPESKIGTVNGYRPPFTEDPRECRTDFNWNTCDQTCWDSCNTCQNTCLNSCDPQMATCSIYC